jgi:tRNA-dihydrouridine synthase A
MISPDSLAPDSPLYEGRLSVAPMLDWTDRHCRFFLRLIAPRTRLYTEMITTGAILHGNRDRLLDFDAAEHPVALQLGGSDPADLAASAVLAHQWGYDEINLNVGCPSDRVQSGRFGACLMATPDLVADCVAAMRAATPLPVTVKHRIGIDDQDSYEHLAGFVQCVAEKGGATAFVVHARTAILGGLTPKQNREIPPLRYGMVHRLKSDFPHLHITINGGLRSADDVTTQLAHVDGVMIGREAYHNPFALQAMEAAAYGPLPSARDRFAVAEAFLPYMECRLQAGDRPHALCRHILGLFQGLPGGRLFRRILSEGVTRPGAGPELLKTAIDAVAARTRVAA